MLTRVAECDKCGRRETIMSVVDVTAYVKLMNLGWSVTNETICKGCNDLINCSADEPKPLGMSRTAHEAD